MNLLYDLLKEHSKGRAPSELVKKMGLLATYGDKAALSRPPKTPTSANQSHEQKD